MIRAAGLVLVVTVLAGCGALRPQPIDVASGQRVVLGRIDLSAMDVNHGIVEIVRQDGAYSPRAGDRPGHLRVRRGDASRAVPDRPVPGRSRTAGPSRSSSGT